MKRSVLWAATALLFPVLAVAATPFEFSRNAGEATPDAPAPNPAPAAVVINEGFDDITTLGPAGWTLQNNSVPIGTQPTWFQGNPTVFAAFDGATNAYIAANFNNTAGAGTIDNWLVSPVITFNPGSTLSFRTRKVTPNPTDFPDRLEVRLCTAMPCTTINATAFNVTLVSVNPTLAVGGYPTAWTEFTAATPQGMPTSGQGRIAFRYFVTDGGPSGNNSDFIGVDRVVIDNGNPARTIGGTVSGLAGTGLVLQNNGGDNLTIGANGAFTFATPVNDGAPYNVTVLTQPSNPSQTCTVSNGSGTAMGANVTNVAVNCVTNTFTVGGTLSGLASGSVTLVNNGGDALTLNANGSFTFATALTSGSPYNVTVQTQPAGQNCTVANGSGTVTNANVTNVAVTCAQTYSVGGTVTGLAGTGLNLQLNGGANLPIAANGAFTFPTTLTNGSPYTVTVATQPTGPVQNCTVTNGSGTIAGANVTNVAVNCVTASFSVGGTVSGLTTGQVVALRLNGGAPLNVNANGPFTFPTTLPDGTPYTVTAAPGVGFIGTCTVTGGTGTVSGGAVSNITVACVLGVAPLLAVPAGDDTTWLILAFVMLAAGLVVGRRALRG